MNDEQLLRDRLNEVVVPPMGSILDRAVADGERRVRRRRTVTASAAAVVSLGLLVGVPTLLPGDRDPGGASPVNRDIPVAAAPSTAPAGLTCRTAGALEKPKNAEDVVVAATDPTGRYAVGNGSKGQDFVPFLWTDGKPERVPYPEASGEMIDVNSAGVAVGRGSDGGSGPDTFFRYADRKIVELRMPAGEWTTHGWPQINTAGDVLATIQPQGSSEGRGAYIVLWPAGSVEPRKLPLPSNATSDIVSDNGIVAGVLRNREGREGYDTEDMQSLPEGTAEDGTLAYVWDLAGKGRRLETPAGWSSAGYGISSDGAWVTGGLWNDAPGDPRSPETGLWNVGTGKLVAKIAISDIGSAVSTAGQVLTQAGGVYGTDGERIAVDGDTLIRGMTDTNRFIDEKLRIWQC
ncbi:hypothetical protein [Actinoplanes couchii]|uniref:Uncharacterized protein n=1 Tax=Actinoplanes couchii TaxID=403638 RepID=A0ABQ3XR33_9ACTN|nr:hypothetical protein [Actinoplanes couchii]MDR6318180.1 hypothetical protein [Actinoplanes couchii]GID60974.1 hypothetical protein Aco03nite_093780 [Actinoplanes couchii]